MSDKMSRCFNALRQSSLKHLLCYFKFQQIIEFCHEFYQSNEIVDLYSFQINQIQLLCSILQLKQEGSSEYNKKMKFLANGLKNQQSVVIDTDSDDSDISEQAIEPIDTENFTSHNHRYHDGHKHWKITPIGRKAPITKPKMRSTHKIEQIEISDGSEQQQRISLDQQSSFSRVYRIAQTEPQKLFKKKLVKVANKCKIEGKEYSCTECSICLGTLQNKEAKDIGKLKCKHSFCFDCILANSKFSNRCPYCRAAYFHINRDGQLIEVQQKQLQEQDFDAYDEPCYVCGRNDDFDHLLQCEYCEGAFCHTYCDNRLESDVPPEESWYCLSCSNLLGNN